MIDFIASFEELNLSSVANFSETSGEFITDFEETNQSFIAEFDETINNFAVEFEESDYGFITSFDEILNDFITEFEYVGNLLPIYEGEYMATPKIYSNIVFPTAQKSLLQNITVYKVPQYEVSNPQGGKTLTIGDDYY